MTLLEISVWLVSSGLWAVGCDNVWKSLATESQRGSVSLAISVQAHLPYSAPIQKIIIIDIYIKYFREKMDPRFIEDDSDQSPYSLWSCIKRALRKKKCTCHLNNFGKVSSNLLSLFFSFFPVLQGALQSKYI